MDWAKDIKTPAFWGQTIVNELKSKVVAGYQMWFIATDSDRGWFHWTKRGRRAAEGFMKVEMWPDVRLYSGESLYPTAFDRLGNGADAALFLSKHEAVVDLHFSWLKEYGIDGLAVQRFFEETQPSKTSGLSHLQMVKEAAEKYEKIFYVMYDLSASGKYGVDAIDRLKKDWVYNVEQKGIVSSSHYAYRNGKPIVCLWGLAESPKEPGRYPDAEVALRWVNWFKERGYYVIGGLPDNNWHSVSTDYADVYRALDMVSPWTVGRYSSVSGAFDWWRSVLPLEQRYAVTHGTDYMPVISPGFSWSNMYPSSQPNEIPRSSGRFLWKQASFLYENGVDTVYVAMFDEYDEGTAIMKAAEDSTQIPVGHQYFLTHAADGTWLSSDYYLRLTGAIGALIKGKTAMSDEPPVMFSNGPVYWRNGFEKRYAANGQLMDVDVGIVNPFSGTGNSHRPLVSDAINVKGVSLEITDSDAKTGAYALLLSGEAGVNESAVYRAMIAPVKIKVTEGMTLSYFIKPMNNLGRRIFADILFDDGVFFSDKQALPVVMGNTGEWMAIQYDLAAYKDNKITGVYAAFTGSSAASEGIDGVFTAYMDDFIIERRP